MGSDEAHLRHTYPLVLEVDLLGEVVRAVDKTFEAMARAEGKCGKCKGAKELFWWHGSKRPCPYCRATGKAASEGSKD